MKITLRKKADRGWPNYLFWGRMRTSTFGLIVAFFVTAWLYNTYQPPAAPTETAPATQVVPPGFVPDPEYTWVPRTSVREYPETTRTTTTPTTTTETSQPTVTSEPTTSPDSTTVPLTTTTPQNPFLPTPPTPETTPTTAPPGPGPTPTPPGQEQ